jgi:hypothetical protein
MLKTPKLNSRACIHARSWPNPADSFITLKVNISNEPQPIQILNATGQLVWQGELEPLQTEIVISINDIPTGLYHLMISHASDTYATHFYKK